MLLGRRHLRHDEGHPAGEHGLGGIALPGLNPGDRFFFDPALDPIWAAIQDTGLPITQHGGAGLPAYKPAGFAMIMMLVAEQSFCMQPENGHGCSRARIDLMSNAITVVPGVAD